MTILRDVEEEVGLFRGRLLAAAGFVLLAFALLAARLIYLQVIRHDELATQAEANRIAVVPIVPNRGLIVDRNGIVLATNYSAYTLEIATRQTRGAALEALVDELAQVVEITARDRRRFRQLLAEMKGAGDVRRRNDDRECFSFAIALAGPCGRRLGVPVAAGIPEGAAAGLGGGMVVLLRQFVHGVAYLWGP
jgi:penicillin-binding protein 2